MEILIVGFGGIGKRHFESIVHLKKNKIYINDINMNFKIEKAHKDRVFKVSDLSDLKGKNIDCLILATSANLRSEIILKAIKLFKLSKIIIEKPIAQSVYELNLLKNIDKKIPIFVNFPLRYYPINVDIKNAGITKDFEISVKGKNWGMACNIWHFVDLVEFLTGQKIINISWKNTKWIESKRPGFKELNGKCLISFTNNINASFFHGNSINSNQSISIKSYSKNNDFVHEIKDYILESSTINKFKKGDQYDIYQSNLTQIYLDENLKNLPRLSDISDTTETVLKSIIMLKYNSFFDKATLPIT